MIPATNSKPIVNIQDKVDQILIFCLEESVYYHNKSSGSSAFLTAIERPPSCGIFYIYVSNNFFNSNLS